MRDERATRFVRDPSGVRAGAPSPQDPSCEGLPDRGAGGRGACEAAGLRLGP
jgi:hypothetical protein